MNQPQDATLDRRLRSWVDSANTPDCDFPIQNLPYGVFRRSRDDTPQIGVAIGDQILNLRQTAQAGLLDDLSDETRQAVQARLLNPLLERGPSEWGELRRALSRLLSAGNQAATRTSQILVAQDDVELVLPILIGDYTDFYASIHHATNVGRMMRPDNPLLPNYKYIPIGYHGRSSSVVVSNTAVRRPWGQLKSDDGPPIFAPSRLLDYEVEVGFVVGQGNRLGTPISIEEAARHIFGFCLVNDWSARDVQKWEYQPLGPFLAKSFATSISPWIVTREALLPFRTAAASRPEGDPQPLPHLDCESNRRRGGLSLEVEAALSTENMRRSTQAAVRLSRGRFADLYWTPAQMLAHHSSSGCNLRPGDLMASGTVSGPDKDSQGSLLELTWRGSRPLQLAGGEERRFLQDGDEIVLTGVCRAEGAVSIGFGECRGRILPAHPASRGDGS